MGFVVRHSGHIVGPTFSLFMRQSTNLSTTTCVWDVTGTQPIQPTLACYETATTYNIYNLCMGCNKALRFLKIQPTISRYR